MSKTTEGWIKHLNETVKCKIAPSNIHGVGVFAIRDLKKGERAFCKAENYEYVPADVYPKLRPEIQELVRQRWPIVIDGYQFVSPNADADLISFMNHSDTPNYSPEGDIALRDIKKGEEVTEHYGKYKDFDRE